jgi:hypothetical protein
MLAYRQVVRTSILLIVQFGLGFYVTAQSNTTPIDQDPTEQNSEVVKILKGTTPEAKNFVLRKFNFINNTVSLISTITSDTNMSFQIRSNQRLSLFLTPKELREITPQGADPLGAELLRRYRDAPPVVPISPLFSQGLKSLIKKFSSPSRELLGPDFPIPKNIEIDVLKVLWVQSAATPSDIYAQIDTLWPVTSEDIHRILEDMANRGFVARKKISPTHAFNLFGFAQIELSSLNRKNEIYLYWPLVPKEKLIAYLEAQRFLAFASSDKKGANGSKSIYQKTLEEKLYRLVR